MPNCFSLTRKGETEPTNLIKVDEELCKHLGVECDPKYWVAGWYDSIGFRLACGIPLNDPKMDEAFKDDWAETLRKILAYIREHFTSDAWAEIGR